MGAGDSEMTSDRLGPGGAALRATGLRLTFPGADGPALDTVDLVVAPGEIVSVLGPSGCGKTTLLRVLTGLVKPDAGHIELDGCSVDKAPVHRRGIGLMFQDHALFPHRDVGGNVEFGLRMAGQDTAVRRQRVGEVLELVGLAGWEARPVGPLSGGERQRVALARALAPEPRLLLLDEPLGSLDRTLRDRLVPELGVLFRSVGVSVVHVTHDHGEALGLADRVVVMDAGQIVAQGTPAELWAHPGSAFVARFLGIGNVVARRSVDPLRPGDEELVLVRPSAMRLFVLAGPSSTAGGGITAEVIRAVFEGERTAITVRTAHDGALLDVRVDATDASGLTIGTSVEVHVEPGAITVL